MSVAEASSEPLLPLYADVLWMLGAVFVVATSVAIIRARIASVGVKIVWIVIVLLVPFLGALAWWLIARRLVTRLN
ncbi:hypothetical protein BFN03_00820 [Rhodococcus sp. WMMA185]|uniref:PLDc N-terminal domain-containing protein n=1 Tax=Rhodococcus sp. WMMA185 TaxID=679318 RepID=UPI00087850B0|nr:hypothetical protein BFN03_00820 [Rhodococcus sp. WMMA185]